MSAELENKLFFIRDRAKMMALTRHFFFERNVMEVDCPALLKTSSIDTYIDAIKTEYGYLHTSPEYWMKRLLVAGSGDIYQLSHVYRAGEMGNRHRPEFMMTEWYRVGFTFDQMIEETLDYCRLFLGNLPAISITYEEVFRKYAEIDFRTKTDDELNIILGTKIEPKLQELTVLSHYPASQCALAQTQGEFAERFEVYYKGVELANGYHELGDAVEQRRRLSKSNQERRLIGKEEYPLDEDFLAALKQGLPDCCGVAVGFDRLMMLRHDLQTISQARIDN